VAVEVDYGQVFAVGMVKLAGGFAPEQEVGAEKHSITAKILRPRASKQDFLRPY
jgi:hypothetical protein